MVPVVWVELPVKMVTFPDFSCPSPVRRKIPPLTPRLGPLGVWPVGLVFRASAVVSVMLPEVERSLLPGSPEIKLTLPPWSYWEAPPEMVTLPP